MKDNKENLHFKRLSEEITNSLFNHLDVWSQ